MNDPTYQNPRNLTSKIKQYINKVANFKEGRVGHYEVPAAKVTKRVLDLAIPHNGNKVQQGVIRQAIDYAKSRGVQLNVIHAE